jgi:hypothetical protein
METESWDEVESEEQGNTTTVTAQNKTTSTEMTVWRNNETSSGVTTSDRDMVSVFTQDSDSEESEDRGDQIEDSDGEDNMTMKNAGTTIWVVMFNGKKGEFDPWQEKHLARANVKGFKGFS